MNVDIAKCIAHYKTSAGNQPVTYTAHGWKLEMMQTSNDFTCEKERRYFVFVVEDVYKNYFTEYINGLEIFDATLTFKRELATSPASMCVDFAQELECVFMFAQNLRVSIEHWALLPNCSLLITEQLTDAKFLDAAVEFIERGGLVATYSPYNQKLLGHVYGQTVNSVVCPCFSYQYSAQECNTLANMVAKNKTHDVAMVPCRFERRQNICAALRAAGISVLEIDDKWGAERDEAIAQCRILLNVHVRKDNTIYEHLRCDRWLFLSNGPVVISETCVNQNTLDCADLLQFVPYEQIVETCLQTLAIRKQSATKEQIDVLACKRKDANREQLRALVHRLNNVNSKIRYVAQYGTEHFSVDVTDSIRQNLCSNNGWLRVAESVSFNSLFGDVATNVPKALYLRGGYVLPERRARPFVCNLFGKPKHIAKIPIFIISHNRLTMLRRCIESIRTCFAPDTYEIVIHDNVSTYQPLIEYLRSSGLRVFWNQRNELDDVALSVAQYFNTEVATQYYAVTDPDIEFQPLVTPADTLTLYSCLLDLYPQLIAVGPELRVDDIPDHYPLKSDLLQRHATSHASDKFIDVGWRGSIVPCAFRKLDTTFGLYRRNFTFRRLNDALLCHGNYCARHLDWYIDPQNMTEDDRLYMQKTTRWGHWSSEYLRPLIKNE